MGGVFFALEVLAITLSTPAIMAIVLAAVTAGLTSYVWSGCTTDLPFHATMAFDWHLIPPVILLGLFCGIYSFYYSSVMTLMKRRYASMGNPWWKNLLSGSVLAILVFLFPALYGEGYSFMSNLLAGHTEAISSYGLFARYGHDALTPVLLAFAIIAVKAFACASSNSGGGVAGDFAPTLMAGCVAGFFFAQLSNTCFGTQLPVADFAFIGMGAVMAGPVHGHIHHCGDGTGIRLSVPGYCGCGSQLSGGVLPAQNIPPSLIAARHLLTSSAGVADRIVEQWDLARVKTEKLTYPLSIHRSTRHCGKPVSSTEEVYILAHDTCVCHSHHRSTRRITFEFAGVSHQNKRYRSIKHEILLEIIRACHQCTVIARYHLSKTI